MSQSSIRLNFLELTPQDFSFTIYRKDYVQSELNENIRKYRLPKFVGDEEKHDYSVSFEPVDTFEPFICSDKPNIGLTLQIIHHMLVKSIREKGIDVSLGKKFYDKFINITVKNYSRGSEQISLNTYYLKQENKFGFLIDSFFKANEGEKLDKELLILSRALDRNGYSNRNYYSDNFHAVQSFIQNTFKKINSFNIGEVQFSISEKLIQLPSDSLSKKVFRFKNEKTDLNQFNGIRKYGAYQEISENIKYVFLFEDRFKSFANNLYFSLIGKTNPGTFPGMKQFFNLPFGNEHLHRITLASNRREDVIEAVNQVIEYKNSNKDFKIIVIFLEPDKFEDYLPNDSPYYILKFYLTKENIPVQVVRDDRTNNANSLKWSTSNIALQIFSKLGGTPWLLKTARNECLILGIGSAYERKEDNSIIKYFAYSVCLDSSGVYKKLDVLAEESSKVEYLIKLEENLVEFFKTPEFNKYKKCALHISESVKKDAIQSIQKALAKISDVEFKVLKINTKHRFFGYSNHNTFVPYESSFIKLSQNEYLIWFDGLVPGKENVYQKIGNPIHIKFLHSENVTADNDFDYLQDAINLSGANWRGFNARQTPISIYYAKIVAEYTAAFSHFNDFDKSHLSNNLPWFL